MGVRRTPTSQEVRPGGETTVVPFAPLSSSGPWVRPVRWVERCRDGPDRRGSRTPDSEDRPGPTQYTPSIRDETVVLTPTPSHTVPQPMVLGSRMESSEGLRWESLPGYSEYKVPVLLSVSTHTRGGR